MLRPHRACSTFGMRDLIRVPSPAARTMTATGRGWLTAASLLGLRAGRCGLRKDQPAEPPAGTGQDASGSGMRRRVCLPAPHLQDTVRRPWSDGRFRDRPEGSRPRAPLPGYGHRPGATVRPDQPGFFPADFVTAGDWPFPRDSGAAVSWVPWLVWSVPTISLGSIPASPATAASSAPSDSAAAPGRGCCPALKMPMLAAFTMPTENR